MSKINFDNNDIQRIEYLKKIGYPDCTKIPLEVDEIKDLRIGTSCYVISRGYPSPRLMMFLGYCKQSAVNAEDGFIFCGDKGAYQYKANNVGQTYNVFRTM